MSDASRLSSSTLPRQATVGGAQAGATGDVRDADVLTRQENLHADNYATGGGLTQPPLALASQPPVPDAPAPRGASLSSAGQSLFAQAQRTSGEAPGGGSPRQRADASSVAEQAAEVAGDAITAAVNKAYASMGRSSAEDEARHQRTQAADIAKSVRAGYRHIDQDHATRESGDILQRAGITEGSKNPAVRLAQLHCASQPGWSGDASSAVSDTLKSASNAATQGLPAFAVGRRDLQG